VRLIRGALIAAAVVLATAGLAVAGATALDRPATQEHDEVVSDAPRRVLWRLLTDFEHYADWNPYITEASGTATEGAKIRLTLDPRNADPYEVTCDVITVHPPRKLYWRCRDHLPGWLDREHTFRLIPMGPGRIRIVYHGRWEGMLVPFADLDDRKRGYERMVEALAKQALRATERVEDGQ